MALTDEQQVIFEAILSSLHTNSKTIAQLTPQTTLGENDWFELNGGRKVAYTVLKDIITALYDTQFQSMQTLITKNVLKSVSFEVDGATATLTIESGGTTITCAVPVASATMAGIITSTDKTKIQTAIDTATTAAATANTAKSTADDAKSTADDAKSTADDAASSAGEAKATANAAKSAADAAAAKATAASAAIEALNDSVRMPNGIAVLDPDGLIAKEEIPTSLRNVIPFDGFYSFDTAPTLQSASLGKSEASIFYCRATKTFIACYQFKYYAAWPDADHFGTSTSNGRTPVKGKIYVDAANKTSYAWDGFDLVVVGYNLELGEEANQAYPGSSGAALAAAHDTLESRVDNILVVPFSGTYNPSDHVMPQFGAWWVPSDEGGTFMVRDLGIAGYTEADYNDTEGNPRTDRLFRHGATLYRVVDGQLVEYGTANAADIDVAKRQVFVDMWLAVNGFYSLAKPHYAGYITQYDATNDKYIVHTPETPEYDMTLTKEEAMRTLMALTTQSNFTRTPYSIGLKVVLPPLNYHYGGGPVYEDLTMATWSGELEVLFLAYGKVANGEAGVRFPTSSPSELKFNNVQKLRAIIGVIYSYKRPVSFPGCKKLEYFRFIISTDFNVQSCPLVRLDSLQYLVANAANGSTVITVTVHPDVYAKLTGDTSNAAVQALTVEELAQWQALVATAQQKKISFATTTNS